MRQLYGQICVVLLVATSPQRTDEQNNKVAPVEEETIPPCAEISIWSEGMPFGIAVIYQDCSSGQWKWERVLLTQWPDKKVSFNQVFPFSDTRSVRAGSVVRISSGNATLRKDICYEIQPGGGNLFQCGQSFLTSNSFCDLEATCSYSKCVDCPALDSTLVAQPWLRQPQQACFPMYVHNDHFLGETKLLIDVKNPCNGYPSITSTDRQDVATRVDYYEGSVVCMSWLEYMGTNWQDVPYSETCFVPTPNASWYKVIAFTTATERGCLFLKFYNQKYIWGLLTKQCDRNRETTLLDIPSVSTGKPKCSGPSSFQEHQEIDKGPDYCYDTYGVAWKPSGSVTPQGKYLLVAAAAPLCIFLQRTYN